MYSVEQLTLMLKKRDDLTRQIADTRMRSLLLFAQRRALDRMIKGGKPLPTDPASIRNFIAATEPPELRPGDVDTSTGLVVGSPEHTQWLADRC
jgi:hypothetical protein